MTKDEALRMALEALDFFEDTAICKADTNIATEAITAIKEALVNVATEDTSKERVDEMQKQRHDTNPPQRTWIGLTDKAVTQVIDSMPKNMKGFMIDWDLYEFSKAIEAKLKQKNGYAEEKNT